MPPRGRRPCEEHDSQHPEAARNLQQQREAGEQILVPARAALAPWLPPLRAPRPEEVAQAMEQREREQEEHASKEFQADELGQQAEEGGEEQDGGHGDGPDDVRMLEDNASLARLGLDD
jgi:hypothetical protein